MPDSFNEKYRGYRLQWGLQRIDDSRLCAYVFVTHGSRPAIVDWAALLHLPSSATRNDAARAGRSAAIRWVDDHLARPGVKRPWGERVREQAERAQMTHRCA